MSTMTAERAIIGSAALCSAWHCQALPIMRAMTAERAIIGSAALRSTARTGARTVRTTMALPYRGRGAGIAEGRHSDAPRRPCRGASSRNPGPHPAPPRACPLLSYYAALRTLGAWRGAARVRPAWPCVRASAAFPGVFVCSVFALAADVSARLAPPRLRTAAPTGRGRGGAREGLAMADPVANKAALANRAWSAWPAWPCAATAPRSPPRVGHPPRSPAAACGVHRAGERRSAKAAVTGSRSRGGPDPPRPAPPGRGFTPRAAGRPDQLLRRLKRGERKRLISPASVLLIFLFLKKIDNIRCAKG